MYSLKLENAKFATHARSAGAGPMQVQRKEILRVYSVGKAYFCTKNY